MQVMFLDGKVQHTRTRSAHAGAWLAHGACKFYRCERSYSVSLRQLPPRLVRELLVERIYDFMVMTGGWFMIVSSK